MIRTLCMAMGTISCIPALAQEGSGLIPPSNLEYTRLWADSIRLRWSPPQQAAGQQKTEWTDLPLTHVATYRLNGITTQGHPRNPASDGEYIYMSSWNSSGASVFFKYDLYGNFIEQFEIEGMEASLRDLAYDGEYFYGGYENINKIAKIDLENRKLIGAINTDRPVRHICYIPTLDEGKGGFEIGDWTTSAFIDRDGSVIKDSALNFSFADDLTNSPYLSVYGTAYHNGKIYAHSELGIMDLDAGSPIPYDGPYSRIVEFDIESGQPTGRRYLLARKDSVLGLDGYNSACGIEVLESPEGITNLLLGFQDIGQNAEPLVVFELERVPCPDNFSGYNLYADGEKINAEPIGRDAYTYDLGNVAQGEETVYSLKALYGSQESEGAELTLNLPDSRQLPFIEDFNSMSLATNYWRIQDTSMDEQSPWQVSSLQSIAENEPNTILLDYNAGGQNIHFSDMLLSKELDFSKHETILIRFQTAQTINWSNPPFCDTLFLEINTGEGWQTVCKDTTQGNGKALTYYTYDITELAAGEPSARFRFRVDGNSRSEANPYGYGFHFYVDNFKVWEPEYSVVQGTVSFGGEKVENVAIRLEKQDDILVYTAETDAQGAFRIEDMETGTYVLTATRPDYNTYTATVELNQTEENVDIRLLQPRFDVVDDTLRITMKPEEEMRSGFNLANSGTGPMQWNAGFEFPSEAKSRKAMEEPSVIAAWEARGNVETSYAFLNDTIYSFYMQGNSRCALLRTLKDGTALSEETLLPLPQYTRLGQIFSDGKDLWFSQSYGNLIFKYDLASNTFTDTIATPLGSIRLAAWNPAANTFFVGDNNTLYEIDKEGDSLHSYDISYKWINYIAVDAVSHEKPVLWVTRNNEEPEGGMQGEYLGVYEFSLDSANFTGRYFIANKHPRYVPPKYTSMETAIVSGFFGTTEHVPGRFTLFVTTGISRYGGQQSANLCAVYDVAQSVKWIGMEEYQGELAAGESVPFYLDFNTEGMVHGDREQCLLNLAADIQIPSVQIPIVLEVDTAYENPCYTPRILSHEVNGMESVDLEWTVETESGALVTENLTGFTVRRNGQTLTDTLVTDMRFRDSAPVMGMNIYEIQASYDFPDYECSSPWSLPDTVTVAYTGNCATVTNLQASTERQRHVILTWDYPENELPEGEAFNESFEQMEAFRNTEDLGNGWTSKDIDRAATYGLTDFTYPHAGEALGFIVFDPMQTTPSSINQIGAYSGNRMVASFNARLDGVSTNDWLISPELRDTTSTMSLFFMARTAFLNYGYEQLKVAYSTTGKDIEDFEFLNDGQALLVPGEWTQYSYTLPKETKYVALNCVSSNNFMLLVDDIYIGPARHHMNLESYSIYKNGEFFQDVTPRAYGFYDFALEDGSYTYTVQAKYDNGCVSDQSEAAAVDIEFKHGITPARGLTAVINDQSKSIDLNWKEPAWGPAEIIGYHNGLEYGFALSSSGNEPVPFSAAIKIDADDQTLMDYSISAVSIGFFNQCKATAFVIDMESGQYVAEQAVPYMNEQSFTTVSFDYPVLLEIGKSYLAGVRIDEYQANTYPLGQDAGPVATGQGEWFSQDGSNWTTLSEQFANQENGNWCIDAVLEVVTHPLDAGNMKQDRKVSFAPASQNGGIQIKRQKAEETQYPLLSTSAAKAQYPEIAIEGYQLCRDGNSLQKQPEQIFAYQDKDVTEGQTYIYQVLTTYENEETAMSDSLQVVFITDVQNEASLQQDFKVWTSSRHVFIQNLSGRAYDAEICNINGSNMARRTSVSESLTEIPMENAAQGLYLVLIRQDGKLFVKKIAL